MEEKVLSAPEVDEPEALVGQPLDDAFSHSIHPWRGSASPSASIT
jgi:hypothetical protein